VYKPNRYTASFLMRRLGEALALKFVMVLVSPAKLKLFRQIGPAAPWLFRFSAGCIINNQPNSEVRTWTWIRIS
jgi:hypothetical protein